MRFNKTALLTTLFLIALILNFTFLILFLGQKQLQGTVFDGTSGKPIPNATLQVGQKQLKTDAQGQFAMGLSNYKQVLIHISAVDYLPTAFTFDIPWYLWTGYINVELAPMGLSFLIVDQESHQPIPEAQLEFNQQVIIADNLGQIKVDPTQQSFPLNITISHPQYATHHLSLARLPQDSSELPLQVGLNPLVLKGAITIEGRNQPLAGVILTAANQQQQTDVQGTFAFSRLSPEITITVKPDDRFLPTEFVYNGQSEVAISVQPRRLQARVVDSFTEGPLHNITIKSGGLTTTTNQNGEFLLEGVWSVGSLTINHPAYMSQTVLYDLNEITDETTPLEIRLRPTTLQGTIRDATTQAPLPESELLINNQLLPVDTNAQYRLADLTHPLSLTIKHVGYKTSAGSINPTQPNWPTTLEGIQVQPCQTPIQTGDNPIPCFDVLIDPYVARAIYIPFGLLSRSDQIYALFDMVDRTELNAVIIDVKGDRGFLAWDSQVLQADLLEIDGEREGWLTLAEFVAEAKARDIYTIARMVTFKDNPLAFGNSDLAIVRADGSIWLDGEDLAWANPFREEVWDYNIALAQEVAAFGFDEINLDYIRFPSDGNLGAIVYAQENTAETRTTAIRTFISRMDAALAPYGTYLSADVFGLTVWVDPESDMNIGQRVIDIAPYVDYLSPMIYPSTFIPGNLGLDNPSANPYEVIYRSQSIAQERVAPPTKVRPWLQAYWYSTDEMLLQKQAANDAGSAGWLWWNAGGVYDETIFAPAQ